MLREPCYQRARQQLLERMYSADAVLQLDDLAYRLRAEKSAAFYALTRLTADGLIRRDPDRGYVIVPFDTRTSDETFDARCAIELGVIDMVVGRVPHDELADLRGRFETMAALLVGNRSDLPGGAPAPLGRLTLPWRHTHCRQQS